MKRRSDTALTVALSLSLISHAGLGVYVVRERIDELTRGLRHPPLSDAEIGRTAEPDLAEPDAAPILAQAPEQTVQSFPFGEPTIPPKPPSPPEKPKAPVEENSEWGEKEGKGTAITAAPGLQEMSARKGSQDQAFTSRDAEGPQPRPEEPSPSTAPPGQNGDNRRPAEQALAGLGTEGAPGDEPQLGPGAKGAAPPPPPRPPRQRTSVAHDDRGFETSETSGPSNSRLPSPQRQSAAEPNHPPAEREGLPNDPAWGDAAQILPIKRSEMIAIRSSAPAYPDVVAALTRPPGTAMSSDVPRNLDTPVLPAGISAATSEAPEVQPATAALGLPAPHREEMAMRVGEPSPADVPAVVDALLHPPDMRDIAGGVAALPEVVSANVPSSPAVADAIIPVEPDHVQAEELAQRLEQPSETRVAAIPAEKSPSASASASAAAAHGGLPGPAVEAADPAPDTGLESDPFAKTPGVEFRDGKVAARSGRQVKPVRPRLTETAKRDLLGLQFPTILAKVRIDKTGRVTDVTVLRGSGSQAVDMPVYRALWDWWFEPPKDKKGNPIDDVQLVAIRWS